MRRLLLRLLVILCLLGFLGGVSWAQTTGSIAGTVTIPPGQ